MYSVILAALLTAGSQETQGHWRSCHGCSGCHGCWGYNAFSCSCSGYGCWGCSGCWGSCSGCWGCHGNYWSNYTVGYSYWGAGCYGSWCTCSGAGWTYYGCMGCTGYAPGWVVVDCSNSAVRTAPAAAQTPDSQQQPMTGGAGAQTAPPPARLPAPVGAHADPTVTPTNPAEVEAVRRALRDARQGGTIVPPQPQPKPPAPGFSTSSDSSRARVVVRLADAAQLWVNEVACPLQGAVRSFDTPALEGGHQYYYTLTVELPQGGRESRRVALTPGRTTEVDFRPLAHATLQTVQY